jgi:hypothetical protein
MPIAFVCTTVMPVIFTVTFFWSPLIEVSTVTIKTVFPSVVPIIIVWFLVFTPLRLIAWFFIQSVFCVTLLPLIKIYVVVCSVR